MTELTPAQIKKDHIRKVLGYITENKSVSRLNLSNVTSLSLMTIGKITDRLLNKGLIVYECAITDSAGRRANYAVINENAYIAVFDVTGDDVAFTLYSAALTHVHTLNAKKDDIFGEVMLYLLENNIAKSVLGAAVIANGEDAAFESKVKSELHFDTVTYTDALLLGATGLIVSEGEGKVLYAKGEHGVFINSPDSSAVTGKLTSESAPHVAEFLGAKLTFAGEDEAKFTRLGAAYRLRDEYACK